MPKHLNATGASISYHSIIIRFTARQWAGLQALSNTSGKSINEIIRLITDNHLTVAGMANGGAQ